MAKRIGWTVIGLVYGLTLAVLGINSSGGGHANVTAMLAFSPYGIGILLWPLLGFLLPAPGTSWSRYIFISLMSLHYLGLIHYLYQNWESESYWLNIAITKTNFIIATTLSFVWYFIGQSFLWLRFLRRSE